MFTYSNRSFQLSLITVFATLLFLGTTGVNTAQAVDFDVTGSGTMKGKTNCFVNATTKATKSKFKQDFVLRVDNVDAALPRLVILDATVTLGGASRTFNMGVPIIGLPQNMAHITKKNTRVGNFFGYDRDTGEGFDSELFMYGKYKLDKSDILKKANGSFTIIDSINDCRTTGKWKAKDFAPTPQQPNG